MQLWQFSRDQEVESENGLKRKKKASLVLVCQWVSIKFPAAPSFNVFDCIILMTKWSFLWQIVLFAMCTADLWLPIMPFVWKNTAIAFWNCSLRSAWPSAPLCPKCVHLPTECWHRNLLEFQRLHPSNHRRPDALTSSCKYAHSAKRCHLADSAQVVEDE